MIQVVMKKAPEVERPTGDTYGLYSKGKPVIDRRGRVRWEGGGWYATMRHTTSYENALPATFEDREILVSMKVAWGRRKTVARLAVRGMWSTREEAEAAALLIVARHPDWCGLLEVRRLVL